MDWTLHECIEGSLSAEPLCQIVVVSAWEPPGEFPKVVFEYASSLPDFDPQSTYCLVSQGRNLRFNVVLDALNEVRVLEPVDLRIFRAT